MSSRRSRNTLPKLCLAGLSSLLSSLLGAVTLMAAIWASGALGDLLGLAGGGPLRLAWDLAGVVMAGTAGFWVLARLAPFAAGAHVTGGLVLLAGLAGWAVWKLGGDFPPWFSAALLLSLPLQAWTGWWLAGGRR